VTLNRKNRDAHSNAIESQRNKEISYKATAKSGTRPIKNGDHRKKTDADRAAKDALTRRTKKEENPAE